MSTYPCPACGATANLDTGCPSCGRAPDPQAAEVTRLTAEIVGLRAEVDQAARRLMQTEQRRNLLAAQVRARIPVAATPIPAAAPPISVPKPETSSHAVQNVLFILGGLMLSVGAIVFALVAWTIFGVAGRAVILAGVTALALAAPVPAMLRYLRATAETFAAVGLLLVILDGYAAWTVNLANVTALGPQNYTAVVCGVTALASAGYALATRLTGPWFAAFLAAQPVLPMLIVDHDPGLSAWALVLAVVGSVDLLATRKTRLSLRILAWLTFGFALAFSVGCTLATLFDTPVDQRLPLAVLILVGSLIAVVPARVKHHTAAAGAALVTVAATAGFSLPWQATAILNTAVVAALVALALVAVSSYPPASPKAGHRSLSWVRAGSAGFLVLHTGIVVPDTQPTTVYAAALLLLVSLAAQFANRVGGQQSRSAVLSTAPVAIPLGLFVLIPALPAIWAVLGSPYRWLGHIWSGRPAGSGVSISDAWPAGSPGEISVALAVLTVAAGVVGFAWNRTAWRLALNVGAITLLIGLAALDAPWPTIPAVSLLLGLLGLLSGRYALPLLLVGAGLAGTLPTEGTTIAGLSLLFIASVAVARLGRTREIRFVAWLVSVAAAATTGAAAALAAGAIRPVVALWVLAAAALALAASAVLRGRIDAPEVVAIEAGGHATALVALLLTIPSGKYAAIACGLWGVAVGVRALWPVENLAARNGRVIAAAGCELLAWWLVLAINGVGPVEVYTLPAAMVALAVSLLIQRGQPVLRSWVVYGPALAAAMLPSLALVLSDPEPLRRLLLGLGAVGVVVLGGVWRQQAPVAIGGVVLAIATLHELALVAQLLPAWIPITILGGLLVWLAITYERRRRDVSRFRHELKGMS